MRNRIIIVVLGLSLGLGARYGVDFYQQKKGTSQTEQPNTAEKTQPPAATPKDK